MRHLLAAAWLVAVLGLTAAGMQALRAPAAGTDLLWLMLAPAAVFDRSICG